MRTLLGIVLLGAAGTGVAILVGTGIAIEVAHAIEEANAALAEASDELDGRDNA